MPLISTPDTRFLVRQFEELWSEGMQTIENTFREMRRRLHLPVVLTFNPGPTLVMQEWQRLVRYNFAWGVGQLAPAVAAQLSFVQLFNPSSAQQNAQVYMAEGDATVAGEFLFTIDQTSRGAPGLTGFSLRGDNTGAPTAIVNVGSAAAASAGIIARKSALASSPQRMETPEGFVCTLPPGSGLTIWFSVVNTPMVGNLLWSEMLQPEAP